MVIFTRTKPFISYRVYMCIDVNDIENVERFGFEWDKEYNAWYLDGHKYKDSLIAKDDVIKMMFKPFKVYGQHQQFL